MESKAAKPPEVYLVGDSPDCLDRFKLTLYNAWRIDAKCLNRKDFDNLSDSDVGKGKVIFVIPHSPRVIIYDESHPTRSFHKQINRAETLQGQRGAFIVVYVGDGIQTESFSDEIRRLYRAGSQTALEHFAQQRQIISLPKDSEKLNAQQAEDIQQFLFNHADQEASKTPGEFDEQEVTSTLSRDLNYLVNREEYSDVVLISTKDQKQVHTLRGILAARSQKFKEELKSAMRDSMEQQMQSGKASLEIDASYKVTCAVVQWITTARLDWDTYQTTEICELLVLADRYKLEDLKQLCERKIIDKISVETVLKLASTMEIRSQPEFNDLTNEHLVDMLTCVQSTAQTTVKDK